MADNEKSPTPDSFDQVCSNCIKSTRYSIYSRSCFMTGEFCSKQANVHREREKLHNKNEINAFVVMNFSEMSDVVYKWKLQPFMTSLKKYLYLDNDNHQIACVANEDEEMPDNWTRVKKINVIRADSNTETNYIICNRICQQMQIADLIIVDVSVENSNVFYEFGMAAAFGKLILPICYSKSFYEMKIPEKAKALLEQKRHDLSLRSSDGDANNNESTDDSKKTPAGKLESFRKLVENHIGSYPWRRKLFEYYGLRYRNEDPGVGYSLFNDIVNPALGFSDQRYNRFPYSESLDQEAVPDLGGKYPAEKDASDTDRKKVGYHIYNLLRNSYNNTTSGPNSKEIPSKFNTLLVYTMDRFLNEKQAGQCIINFYRNMTAQIQKEHCFCGDRVGILGQGRTIHDDPKDTQLDKKLPYNVSDIIRIGMNEATHVALQRKIKPEEFLDPSAWTILDAPQKEGTEKTASLIGVEGVPQENDAWIDEMLHITKAHISNRCIPIHPDEPIYVDQLKNGIQKGILDEEELTKKLSETGFNYKHFFNLFHVMLYTLRYTNQVVVDLSRNSLQALFWLGVAHGSDVPAITVRHVPTREELERSGNLNEPPVRTILDVAGLWTAYFYSNDTEGFYNSLAVTQVGIERNSKLNLADQDTYPERMLEQLYAPFPYSLKEKQGLTELNEISNMNKLLAFMQDDMRVGELREALAEKNREECRRMESFYRERFWRRLLRYNDLRLYLPRKNGKTNEQPRLVNITWDVDSMAELSHYLSKRKIIGSYRQYSLDDKKAHPDAHQENFISIGGDTTPLLGDWENKNSPAISLVEHIQAKDGISPVREMRFYERKCQNHPNPSPEQNDENGEPLKLPDPLLSYRGFFHKGTNDGVFTQFVAARCGDCSKSECGRTCTGECSNEPDPSNPNKPYFDTCTLPKDFQKLRNNIYIVRCDQQDKEASGTIAGPGKNTLPDEIPGMNKVATQDNNQLQLGQLLLWREVPDGEKDVDGNNGRNIRYWVSLEGISGPSTLALTSLLVDDKQKKELLDSKLKEDLLEAKQKKADLEAKLKEDTSEDELMEELLKVTHTVKDLESELENHLRLPLNSLQSQVRKVFMRKYWENLGNKLKDAAKIPELEKMKFKYASSMYLSTVLYQYFLPFLSTADEHRICNGLHAYLCAMAAADGSNFKHMRSEKFGGKTYLQHAEDAFRSTIKNLCGVEALYVVKVHSSDTNTDKRRPVEIQMLEDQQYMDNGKPQPVEMVSCLFLK